MPEGAHDMLDTNALAGHWPFDRLIARTPPEVETHLRAAGITAACAYPVEAVFYPDPHVANVEFLGQVKGSDFFIPSGVVDPTLENWCEVVDGLTCTHSVRMIRLFPNYHRYELSDSVAGDLLEHAAELDVAVAVHVRLLDERRHHPLTQVPAVPVADVSAAAGAHPDTRILLCCALIREARSAFSKLRPDSQLYADISSVEYVSTIEHLVRDVPVDRVVLGTHAPLYYPHAGVAKVNDAPLPEDQVAAIKEGNARRLLGLGKR